MFLFIKPHVKIIPENAIFDKLLKVWQKANIITKIRFKFPNNVKILRFSDLGIGLSHHYSMYRSA